MRIRTWVYVLAVLALFLDACKSKNDIEEQRYLWSTDAPLSIPYRVRLQRFERTNLIRNPSFETGRIFRLDSNTTSFVIDGWQQVGSGVQWADRLNDSLFAPDEVFSGLRSVKITRKNAMETELQGEGIQSDFIKVIPGNYSLSLYARLADVAPNRSRLGTRMFDAINIRLQFYDRNKIVMNPAYRYPHENQMIDASFKGLSFANFETIPEFGWGKIIGKSNHFPFPEGDIPSDAHFVKIFIGLKGTGTLWVDSVMLNYTDKNFSIAERMQAFTDTAFSAPEMFIPSPRKVTRMESLIYAGADRQPQQIPLIVSDDQNPEAVQLIMNALQSVIPANMSKSLATTKSVSENQLLNSKLIISIGNTAIYQRFKQHLPENEISNKPEGYFIYTPGDFTNVVILGANNSTGLYYAALTAIQMIDPKVPVFHNARIIDYPDYDSRFCTLDPAYGKSGLSRQKSLTDELIRYKINGALVLNSKAEQGDMEMFRVIPVSGYLPPDDTLVYRYPLKPVKDTLDLTGEFEFPAAFHNEMLDNGKLGAVTLSGVEGYSGPSPKKLYSGPSFFSLNTDAADIQRFTSVYGSAPVYMDNSMRVSTEWAEFAGNDRFYHGKIRLFNLFDPFSNMAITEYSALLDTSVFVINLPPASETEIIRLATAADYMWNASAYSKDYSLWKVLVSRYGSQNARDLIQYADKYALLLESLLRVEKNLQASRKVKSGQAQMVEITALTAQIGGRLGSQHNLVKELQLLNSGLRNRMNLNKAITPARK